MIYYLIEEPGIFEYLSAQEIRNLSEQFLERWENPRVRDGFRCELSELERAVLMLKLERLEQ